MKLILPIILHFLAALANLAVQIAGCSMRVIEKVGGYNVLLRSGGRKYIGCYPSATWDVAGLGRDYT